MRTFDWSNLPLAVLDRLREVAERGEDRGNDVMKVCRKVNRHWGAWATGAVTALNINGHLPLQHIVNVISSKFTNVQALSFRTYGVRAMTNAMEALGGMQQLTYLDLGRRILTDEDILHVGQLANLRHLSISGPLPCALRFGDTTEISDDGLAHLSGLTALTFLDLDSCPRCRARGWSRSECGPVSGI
eukprot:evm.model.scf_61.2 EVM.evm.TU.scf_61.2   scf_61:170355-170918(-)